MSTKDLKRTLGKGDLMGIAVGQIIGAGIMSLTGVAIAMTGRSANIAFLLSTLFVVAAAIPLIFVNSCIRMRGGVYTQTNIFLGKKWAGVYIIQYIVGCISISLFAISLAQYIRTFIPVSEKIISIVVLSIFFIINYFGISKAAKIQKMMVFILGTALLIFVIFGIFKIKPGYFKQPDFTPNGLLGILQTAALLVFATGGAEVIVDVSSEAKNPKKDIPKVVIISTLLVALLYAIMSTVAAGVLPIQEVANKTLSVVAEKILPRPLFLYFVICGAIFATATTLNAKIGTCTKPVLQACSDGWFPRYLEKLHPKYKTPVYLLGIFYIIGLLPILFGFDIVTIASTVVFLAYSFKIFLAYKLLNLPTLFPKEWNESPYKVSLGKFKILIGVSMLGTFTQCFLLILKASKLQLIGTVAVFAVALLYVNYRYKYSKNFIEDSFETE
ncbi:MAG: APC family permease [Fusobacteriaceae bacterium]